jgi:hypothetical protein
MAVRSIIDVQVNSGQFQQFVQLYQRYQQTLPATVQAWQQVNTRVSAVTSVVKSLQSASATVASSWRNLATHTANVASNLKSATESLLRWTSITSVVSSLVGIGSLFGLEHLARGVGTGRREAEGVGTTYGQQRAFELTYGRFVDSDILGRVSHAYSDPAQGRIFQGVSPGAMRRGDSVEIARELLPIITNFAKNTDEHQLKTLAGARGYLEIVSLETLKRLRREGGDLAGLDAGFPGLAKSLSRTQDQERAFQNFDKALNVAESNITNAFVTGLAPAIPQLTKLSETVSGLLVALLKDAITPERVTAWGDSISQFTKEIGAPEFQAKMHEFVKGVGDMADALASFLSGGGKVMKGLKYLATTTPAQAVGDITNALFPPSEVANESGSKVFGIGGKYSTYRKRLRNMTLGFEGFPPAPEAPTHSSQFSKNDIHEKVFVANNSHNALWLMVQAPNGANTARNAAMLGAGFGNFSGVAPFPG